MEFEYRFIYTNGAEETFKIALDAQSLSYLPPGGGAPPAWTALENHQCTNCPLNKAESPHCPVARNLAPMITRFFERISFEEVDVVVKNENREYRKRVSLQKGISALFGLVIGNRLHHRLSASRIMAFVFMLIIANGAALVVRAW